MILGVGVDMARVPRFERLLERFGARFIEKVMTPDEMRRWPEADGRRLAKLFSAKEAAVKALGSGFRQGVTLQTVSIEQTPLGAPVVSLSGAARERLDRLGASQILLSISDEEDTVVAFALAQ
ncbi:MAG: holo-ACP synthase [Luminiphilus sp.]|nr:holo-ACP synthase [Luminiphilus sp.]